MKKLCLTANGKFRLEEATEVLHCDEMRVVVAPLRVGICSSDIPRAYNSKSYHYPLILGHEIVCRIVEARGESFADDSRYVVFPLIPCMKCNYCQDSDFNLCQDYSYYGSRQDGGMQERLKVFKWNLLEVPPSLDSDIASLCEPTAVCVHATKLIDNSKSVLLWGGGFLAQIIALMLLERECEVTCIDRNGYKKKFFGHKVKFYTNREEISGAKFDVAIDCCGVRESIAGCINACSARGLVIHLANPGPDSCVIAEDLTQITRKELTVRGTWNSSYRPDDASKCDWTQALSFLNKYQEHVRTLITHKAVITDAANLFDAIYTRRREEARIVEYNKAVIEIQE